MANPSNETLRHKIRRLHLTVVNSINPSSIIDYLFQERVIGQDDVSALRRFVDDPRQQSRELLALLHMSEHPQAFIKLYVAIKQESHLNWLVERIDSDTEQEVTVLSAKAAEPNIAERTVGEVAEPVCGITSLENELLVLRWKECDQVAVYDINNYRLRRHLTVPNAGKFSDMTSCGHYRCLYISDSIGICIHRLGLHGAPAAAARWAVTDKPLGLSMNAAHNLLVTCPHVHKITELNPSGSLLREIELPDGVLHPWHAAQLSSDGQMIMCHGKTGDRLHRVCVINSHGSHILRSHGGQPGASTDQYNQPTYLAIDNYDFVHVLDFYNRRVTLLSPTLEYLHQVVTPEELKGRPTRLYLDVQRRRLYVADNEWDGQKYTAGRVVVISV